VSATALPALLGLGSFKDGQASSVVLDSAEVGRLVRSLRDRPTAVRPEAAELARKTSAPWVT
jgi:hypothetical protein